jgi:anti-sigma regulatory factor (Ser/Thr protein kinase)
MEWRFRSGSQTEARNSRAEFMSELRRRASAKSDLAAAELIFGELIGNVVKHAPGAVRVRLDWSGPRAVLSVHDEHAPFTPKFKLPENPMAEGGRGLFIAKALSTSIAVTHIHGDGTKVAVGLPVWRAA